MRYFVKFAALLFLASTAAAQFTTVSGTVTDPNGLPYAGGTISASLVISSTPKFTASNLPYTPPTQPAGLSSNGSFVMNLADVTLLTPGGGTYSFTVCSSGATVQPAIGKGPVCFTVTGITISGASQSITATLTAAAPVLATVGSGTGFPITTPQTVNNGGAVTPNNATTITPFGQISATGDWFPLGQALLYPPAPTLTANTTGGSLVNTTQVYVRLIYAGPATIQPSAEVNVSPPGGLQSCSGGNSCSVTVNMPTSCTAGNLPATVTGCTVAYSTTGGSNTEQIMAGCTNITTATCTITAAPAGAALSYQTTSGILPPGAQAPSAVNKIIPISYLQKGDNNYYPAFGVDGSAINNSAPHGILTLMTPLFYNDTTSPPLIANVGGISIHHQMGNNQNANCGTGANICADFALGVEDIDTNSTNHNWEQSLSIYAERQIFDNSFTCAPTGSESCAAAIRGTFADNRTSGSTTANGLGNNGLAGYAVKASNGNTITSTQIPYVGVFGVGQNGSTQNMGGQAFVGVAGWATEASSCTVCSGWSIFAKKTAANFALGETGVEIDNFNTGRGLDFALKIQGGNTYFGDTAAAPIYLQSILTNSGTIAVTGGLNMTSGVSATGLAAPSIPVINVTNGAATTWTYRVGCVDAAGNMNVSASNTTGVGAANLTGTAFNTLTITPVLGCASYNIILTVAGGTCNGGACGTGVIANVVPAFPGSGNISGLSANFTFVHNGQTASPNVTAPGTQNNTGGLLAAGFVNGTNTVRVTSNFVTANNASLQNITGLSWNLFNTAAQNLGFACDISYQQGTAAAAVAFGIQAATNNLTNIFAVGNQQITVGPPATYVSGTLATLSAAATPTNIVSGTPGAQTTNYTVHLGGMIENPANTPNTINIMVSTAAGADAVTVLRGSMCYITP